MPTIVVEWAGIVIMVSIKAKTQRATAINVIIALLKPSIEVSPYAAIRVYDYH
jgi:hypothetical protein